MNEERVIQVGCWMFFIGLVQVIAALWWRALFGLSEPAFDAAVATALLLCGPGAVLSFFAAMSRDLR